MIEQETVKACEEEVQTALKKHGCILETHTVLVNGVMTEQRIVAVIQKEPSRIHLPGGK